MIERINRHCLCDDGHKVSVSIVDSGFSNVPSYASIYGSNSHFRTEHGNRILSVFTALDDVYPIKNMMLNLACYNPSSGYDGLIRALRRLPHSDILSLSMLWNDDNQEIKKLLMDKADVICVPIATGNLHYPSDYGFTVTCSNKDNSEASYCICPNSGWKGNSYSVPAIARLLAYGHGIDELSADSKDAIGVDELFSRCRSGTVEIQRCSNGIQTCPHCHRYIRNETSKGFVNSSVMICPYCGLSMKRH